MMVYLPSFINEETADFVIGNLLNSSGPVVTLEENTGGIFSILRAHALSQWRPTIGSDR